MRIVSIGEILWDVIGSKEYLGGAPLNFAAHAQILGHEVFMVSAVGDDERGRRALAGLQAHGLACEMVQALPGKPTGTAEVELDAEGKPQFRIVRPAAYDFVSLNTPERKRIADLRPDWIYFGTLFNNRKKTLASTLRLLAELPNASRFYDVNLRDGQWNLGTVEQLAVQATVIKLSDSEAQFLDGSLDADNDEGSVEHFCQRWSDQYNCKTVCVTFGERGCGIYKDCAYCEVPGCKVQVADTVGAGDAFAAAFLHGLSQGWTANHIGKFANAVAALVASRAGAIPDWGVQEVQSMIGGG